MVIGKSSHRACGALSHISGNYINILAAMIVVSVLFGPGDAVATMTEYLGAVGFGIGGEHEAVSFGFEMGTYWPATRFEPGTPFIFGLGFGISATGDDVPDFAGSGIPHGNYSLTTGVKDGPELEAYIRAGFRLSRGIYITPLGGISTQKTISYATSNVTGWKWLHKEDAEIYGVYGVGVVVFVDPKLALIADYTNRRGPAVLVGFALGRM